MRRLLVGFSLIGMFVLAFVLGSAPAPTAAKEFPDDWYFGGRKPGLIAMEGKQAPALQAKNWIGKVQNLTQLKGKVVVVDFWATWCGPCVASVPKNIDLVNKYEKEGFVFIGLHESNRGAEKMSKFAKDKKINYPLAVDKDNKTGKAYNVGFYPTYVVIDRKGVIRAAGLQPGSVEKVVKKLLEEKAPETPKQAG